MRADEAAAVLTGIFGREVTAGQAKQLREVVGRELRAKASWEDVIGVARSDQSERNQGQIWELMAGGGTIRPDGSIVDGVRGADTGRHLNDGEVRSVENLVMTRLERDS